MTHLVFKNALQLFGGNQSAMARALLTSQQRISYIVRHGTPCPPDLVLPCERATGISRHELRPDLYPREESAAA